jgi:molybdopterin molybdotransferase
MTGGILPEGCDTVIRYEDLEIKDQMAQVNLEALKPGKNVHPRAADRRAGEPRVPAGKIISGAELGVAATIGKTQLLVSRLPKSIIISTGDELVPIEAQPLEHQIRRSNVYSIFAALQKFGIEADLLHLQDDLDAVTRSMASVIREYNMIILSGGVSKGKFDFLPAALDELGVKKVFHRIKLRPGKPFWFGTAQEGGIIFALPGNPVSSFMCTQRFVVPWIKKSLQVEKRARLHATLSEDFTFKPDLTYFLQVRVQANEKGALLATPIVGNGSGDLANLGDADAFLELPRGRNHFHRGEAFPLIPYRDLT